MTSNVLYPKNWTEEKSEKCVLTSTKKKALKTAIKSFVKEPKEYREIIDMVQEGLVAENKHVLDEEIVELIKEINIEWNPPKLEEIKEVEIK